LIILYSIILKNYHYEHNNTNNKSNVIRLGFQVVLFSLTICINLISYGQGCGTSNLNSYDDLIPDLYPTRTVRVALQTSARE